MTQNTKVQRWARTAAWAVSLTTTVVGVILIMVGKTSLWVRDPNSPDTYTSQTVQVGLLGLAILCVGILSVMAVLIAEGYAAGRPAAEVNCASVATPVASEFSAD